MPQDPADGSARPLLSVVRGQPDADELAAVVVVLAARARRLSTSRPGGMRPQRGWSSPADRMRRQLSPGPGAWRASALP